MHSELLYSDKLVVLTEEFLLLHSYYMYFGSKRVDYKDIEAIEVHTPIVRDGKLSGPVANDFRTWLPMDWKRNTRDKLFVIAYRDSGKRIGFTAEDSAKVIGILQGKGLIRTTQSP